MIKKITFLLLSCNIFFNTNGMLKQYNHVGVKKLKYPTHCISNDVITSQVRETLENMPEMACITGNAAMNQQRKYLENQLIKKEYLYSIKKPTIEEESYDCTRYAFSQTLGFKKDTTIILESTIANGLDMFKYFKQTNNPKNNDIIVYSASPQAFLTSHLGIVHAEDKIESKWGNSITIAQHKKANIPFSYGNYFRFYTLKNKFRVLPRHLLLNLIEYDTSENEYKWHRRLNDGLLRYYSLIANLDVATASKIICAPLSTIELLKVA